MVIQSWEVALEPDSNELRVLCALINGGVGYSGLGRVDVERVAADLGLSVEDVVWTLSLLELDKLIEWASDEGEVFVRGMIERFVETHLETIRDELDEHAFSAVYGFASDELMRVLQ